MSKEAEAQFGQAIDHAHKHGVLAWELRAAMSLARLWRRERRTKARTVLAPVVRRFTEGFETADLVSARALLRRLS